MDNVVLAYEQSTTDTMSRLKCILQTKVDHNFHKHNYSILLLFNHTADLRHRATYEDVGTYVRSRREVRSQ